MFNVQCIASDLLKKTDILRSCYTPNVFCLLALGLPWALLSNLVKALSIKPIESLPGTPPHISCAVLIHTLHTAINPISYCKYGECFKI